MTDYEGVAFDPPAPVAEIVVRNPGGNSEAGSARMLIDTGADVTLIPNGALQEIGLSPVPGANYRIRSFNGSQHLVPAADLIMVFMGRELHGRFLLIDSEIGFLGRDVLNEFVLEFDGPEQAWRARG